MASHIFDCGCGEHVIEFRAGESLDGTPCPECGEPLVVLLAGASTGIAGDDWFHNLNDHALNLLEVQLGTRPESPSHLRRIEKRLGVERNFGNVAPISEVIRQDRPKTPDGKLLREAIEKGKAGVIDPRHGQRRRTLQR